MGHHNSLLSFIRLHTAPSPKGAEFISSILTDEDITENLMTASQALSLNPLVLFSVDYSPRFSVLLEKILDAAKMERVVFLFVKDTHLAEIYNDLMNLRDKTASWSKFRLFLIIARNNEKYSYEATRLSDFTLSLN